MMRSLVVRAELFSLRALFGVETTRLPKIIHFDPGAAIRLLGFRSCESWNGAILAAAKITGWKPAPRAQKQPGAIHAPGCENNVLFGLMN
jgi:hypothetical protein